MAPSIKKRISLSRWFISSTLLPPERRKIGSAGSVSACVRRRPGCNFFFFFCILSFWCSAIGRGRSHCAASGWWLRSDSAVGESKTPRPRASSLKEAAAESKQRDVHRICISCFICVAAHKLRNKMKSYCHQSPGYIWPCRSESEPRTLEVSRGDETNPHLRTQAHTMAQQTLWAPSKPPKTPTSTHLNSSFCTYLFSARFRRKVQKYCLGFWSNYCWHVLSLFAMHAVCEHLKVTRGIYGPTSSITHSKCVVWHLRPLWAPWGLFLFSSFSLQRDAWMQSVGRAGLLPHCKCCDYKESAVCARAYWCNSS